MTEFFQSIKKILIIFYSGEDQVLSANAAALGKQYFNLFKILHTFSPNCSLDSLNISIWEKLLLKVKTGYLLK